MRFRSGIVSFMRYSVFLFSLFCVLLAPQVRAAPAQQAFSDWQVTCNNQNFCVARNTGEHRGLVMTLSRSAGAKTDATLRIDLGGLDTPSGKRA
jgi:invasion protein IalB